MLKVLFNPVHFGRIILLDAARVVGVTTIVVFTPPFAVVIKVVQRLVKVFLLVDARRWVGNFMSVVRLDIFFSLEGMNGVLQLNVGYLWFWRITGTLRIVLC